jgi:hypothetical protein
VSAGVGDIFERDGETQRGSRPAGPVVRSFEKLRPNGRMPAPERYRFNYGLRASKSGSCLTKFLVNDIHIYDSESIYYENTFRV